MISDERKEYDRLYRLKNKEKSKEYNRLYNLKNKEEIKERNRLYTLKHKEKCKEYQKEYRQTEKFKKSNTISVWKRNGIICEDYDKMYDTYINTKNCEWCDKDIRKKQELEHNHSSREVRGIVCKGCNMKIMYKDRKFQKVMSQLRDSINP